MKKISRRNFLLASGVVTVGAALAACGGGSSSSTAASSAAPASSAAAPASAEGKVLNIWCWNDHHQAQKQSDELFHRIFLLFNRRVVPAIFPAASLPREYDVG